MWSEPADVGLRFGGENLALESHSISTTFAGARCHACSGALWRRRRRRRGARLRPCLLPRSLPLASSIFIPVDSAKPDEVGLDHGDHREDGEQQPSEGVGWVVHRPAILTLICRAMSWSAIARASGRDLASRSSLVTTRVAPAQHAARGSRSSGAPGCCR